MIAKYANVRIYCANMLIKAQTISYFWLKFVKLKAEHPNALRFLLQDELYLLNEDKSLYDSIATAPQPPEIETVQPNFNYLGNNKKNFLVLVHYTGHEFMPDTHLTALESVLSRKNHSRDDVAILNLAKHTDMDYEQISTYFEPQTLVLLGKESIPVGFEHPQFNQPENRDGLNLLYTFSFDEMMSNTDNKKAFWEQIKNL
jgi:hypothetical protein